MLPFSSLRLNLKVKTTEVFFPPSSWKNTLFESLRIYLSTAYRYLFKIFLKIVPFCTLQSFCQPVSSGLIFNDSEDRRLNYWSSSRWDTSSSRSAALTIFLINFKLFLGLFSVRLCRSFVWFSIIQMINSNKLLLYSRKPQLLLPSYPGSRKRFFASSKFNRDRCIETGDRKFPVFPRKNIIAY